MKNIRSKIFLLILVCCASILCFSACDGTEDSTHTHTFDAIVTTPTCTERGYTTHSCSCGESYIDTYVSVLDHQFSNYVSDGNATEDSDGTKTAHCDRTGCNETHTIKDVGSQLPPSHAHSYVESITQPTCTEQGYTTHFCACGHSYTDTYTTATNHKFTTYVSDGNATTETDGTKTAHCENNDCNETDTIADVGSKLPSVHSHTYISNVSQPTCTEQGYTQHSCSCGDSYRDNYISAKGHTFEATTCSSCKINISECAIDSYDLSINVDGKITAYVVGIDNLLSVYVLGEGQMKNYDSSNTPFYVDGYYDKITLAYFDDGIENIGNYLLYSCSKITDIRLPNSLKSIGNSAFFYCSSVKGINIPTGVTNIGSYSFYNLNQLLTITIPDSVKSIGESAFSNCSKLETININTTSQLNSLGDNSFNNTAYYKNSANWTNKVLYINSCLIEAKATISGEFEIPDGTTVIAEKALYGCTSLTKIVVPDTVQGIGKGAFQGCNGLKYIKLPFCGATIDGTIDDNFGYVFGSYSGYSNSNYVPSTLTEVVITGGDRIDSYAFYGCDFVITLTLPYVGTSLNSGEFLGSVFGATNTSNYVVPDSLTTITILSGDIVAHAFHGCDSLINVYIENGVTSIGEGAFYNCSSIQNIRLPFVGQNSTLTSGYNAVFGYVFGYGIKTISYGTTGTGAGMYWSMSDYDISINQYSYTQSGKQYLYYYKVPNTLKTVTITDTDYIPQEAFYKCSMIDRIIIPKDAEIGRYAFDSCSAEIVYSCKENEHNIVEIERVEPTCQSVGNTEGIKCSICGIVFSGNLEIQTLSHQFVNGACSGCGEKEFSKGLLFTLDEASDTYIVSGIGTYTDVDIVIPSKYNGKDVTIIGEEAFYNCTTIQSITIPSTITKSRSLAFYGCTSLKAVYIDDIAAWCSIFFTNMRYSNPLEQAKKLYLNGELVEQIVIPEGPTKVSTLAFINCETLVSIEIPNSVTSIGQDTFKGCTNLKTIKIGSGVTEIWDGYSTCSALENIYINSMEQWLKIDFKNASNPLKYAQSLIIDGNIVTEVIIPSSIIKIKSAAFAGYASLRSVTLHNEVANIGDYAFYGCTNLQTVTIGEKVSSIGEWAFKNCTSLQEIYISSTVTTIESSAFAGCSSITISCRASSKPSGWATDWNSSNCTVIWNTEQ